MSCTGQRTSSIFYLLYHFICTVLAQYNMAGVNLIDQNGFRVLNFGPVIDDKAIEKSIFVAFEGKTCKQCLLACSSSPGCVAYNYGSNGGICQLSNDTSPCALVSKPGFIHQGVFNFRECYKGFGINVSVTSGNVGKFVVNEISYELKEHGYIFLAVHMNGSIHESGTVRHDLAHDDPPKLLAMNAYIAGLPDGVVVLMAAVHHEVSKADGVGNITLLGSNLTNADLAGKYWWALIGYKGAPLPWITEALSSTDAPVTRSTTTYTLY